VLDDTDLMGLVRYVCLNPLEGSLVANPGALEHFPWCSAGTLLGLRPPLPFEAVAETLALFDAEPVRARARLGSWLDAPGPASRERAAAAVPTTLPPVRPPDTSLARLVREVCLHHEVSEAELRSHRRDARTAGARARSRRAHRSSWPCRGASWHALSVSRPRGSRECSNAPAARG
jgi:hypothetical protein